MNPFPQQPTLSPCPECGGRRVIGNHDRGITLRAELRTPAGHPLSMTVAALICTNCGHISLRTNNLPQLFEDIQKHSDHYRS